MKCRRPIFKVLLSVKLFSATPLWAALLWATLLIAPACSKVNLPQGTDEREYPAWTNLVDAELSKWDQYLSFQHQVGYDGTPPKNDQGDLIAPIGLNQPGYEVFSTVQEEEDLIIRISGEYYGCLVTKEEFENYHFQLKFKWGNEKWAIRKDKLMDSGILYHSIGPLGAEFWRTWMLSQEFQIMEGHTGDFWSPASSAMDIRAYKPESNLNPLAHESQAYLTLSMTSPYKNYCLRSGNFEQPFGEWNTLDLYCFEGKSLHVVNGEVVMILKNSRYTDDEGKSIPLTKGKIQLQSEAAEIFFKDIQIRKIDSLSAKQAALF
ncbi:MAG: DUF1080 domain-containing protein [Bacteroidota bacterium]